MIEQGKFAGVFAYDISYYSAQARIDQFAAGMLAYRIQAKNGTLFSNPIHIVFSVALLTALFFFSSSYNWADDSMLAGAVKTYYLSIEGALCAYLMLAVLQANIRIPFERFLSRLGVASYSVYLWHQAIVATYLKEFPRIFGNGVIDAIAEIALVLFPVVMLVSYASFKWLEEPMLEFRKNYRS